MVNGGNDKVLKLNTDGDSLLGEELEREEELTVDDSEGKREEDVAIEEDVEKREKEERLQRLRAKQQEAKGGIEERSREVNMVSVFTDEDGDEIAARRRGKVSLEVLNIEEQIIQVKRFRGKDDNVHGLQDSIRRYGLLNPVHVVPYGDLYILVQGHRRLQAYVNLGKQEILAVVDHTIPPELVKYYQVELNNVLGYKFIERLKYGKFVEETQPQMSIDVIEQSLGLVAGEYLKMKYIEQFSKDFPDIYIQVQNGRMTVDQAYKKIDKEIEKQQKEMEKLETESEDMDNLRDVDELSDLANEANQQELGNRKVLDPVIRRSVESRAGGACECCSYGKDVPDLMGVFQVHHIVPVQYGGDDSKGNLILLCHNCHKLVHDYETGRFSPEQDTYNRLDEIKRIVVLGNMLRILRKMALYHLRSKHVEVARQVEKNVITIGQGIQKAKAKLDWESEFEYSPYDTFIKATENLRYGGGVQGKLSVIEDINVEDESDGEDEDVAQES